MYDPNYGKTGFALRLFRLRFRKLRVSQSAFAERFGLSFGSIKDLEQGRVQPTRAVLLLIAAIEADADMMARVAERERDGLAQLPAAGHRWASKVQAV